MKKKIIVAILAGIIALSAFAGWKFFGPALSTASGEFFYVKGNTVFQIYHSFLVRNRLTSWKKAY